MMVIRNLELFAKDLIQCLSHLFKAYLLGAVGIQALPALAKRTFLPGFNIHYLRRRAAPGTPGIDGIAVDENHHLREYHGRGYVRRSAVISNKYGRPPYQGNYLRQRGVTQGDRGSPRFGYDRPNLRAFAGRADHHGRKGACSYANSIIRVKPMDVHCLLGVDAIGYHTRVLPIEDIARDTRMKRRARCGVGYHASRRQGNRRGNTQPLEQSQLIFNRVETIPPPNLAGVGHSHVSQFRRRVFGKRHCCPGP